jgi:hypothetical protein
VDPRQVAADRDAALGELVPGDRIDVERPGGVELALVEDRAAVPGWRRQIRARAVEAVERRRRQVVPRRLVRRPQ